MRFPLALLVVPALLLAARPAAADIVPLRVARGGGALPLRLARPVGPPAFAPSRPLAPRPGITPVYDRLLPGLTRGIDPHAAVAGAPNGGGSAGRYATQARPVMQARQGTQVQQVRQLRIVRPFAPIPIQRRRP
jgi:hypothetical protein